MILLDNKQTIKELTYKMSNKERFALVNFSRSALLAAAGKMPQEKRPPKPFTRSIINSLENNHQNFMKGIPYHMTEEGSGLNLDTVSGLANARTYDAGMLENYFLNRRDVFDAFVNFYIRHSSNVVVTFHDKKVIQKVIGTPTHVIQIPYNDFYDKLDSIVDQVIEVGSNVDYCILDCPVLASALGSKLWERSNISILDFGKVFTIASK